MLDVFTDTHQIQFCIGEFSKDYLEPMLSNENKICILIGDFNIDLTKMDMRDKVKQYYSTLLSYFFAPCILQPTRPQSKTLIDNIFY